MYRRLRRNRLWYRKPRFNNRKKKEGLLPPSVQRKFDTHITLINKLKSILPITSINIEAGKFDIQKIMNPEIKGIQYQQGSLYEYQNMRSYLMAREHGKCQLCGKEFSKGNETHIHHKKARSDGGTDSEKNLALLHKKCHNKLHDKKLFHLLKTNKTYKDATFMNIIRWRFKEIFNCCIKYGYETFIKRNEIGLEKTHFNDAFIIANGINQIKNEPITIKQKHRNNRVLQVNRKGYKPSIRMKRYSIQPYDIVAVGNKNYVVKGSHCYGKMIMCTDSIKTFDFNIKKIESCFHTKSIFLFDTANK